MVYVQLGARRALVQATSQHHRCGRRSIALLPSASPSTSQYDQQDPQILYGKCEHRRHALWRVRILLQAASPASMRQSTSTLRLGIAVKKAGIGSRPVTGWLFLSFSRYRLVAFPQAIASHRSFRDTPPHGPVYRVPDDSTLTQRKRAINEPWRVPLSWPSMILARYSGQESPRRSRQARTSPRTASMPSGVSFPVKVFCCDG
jgi:hypothetical protein